MPFDPVWTDEADGAFGKLQESVKKSFEKRRKDRGTKATRAEGLFKQIEKCVRLLLENPKHPGLNTHEYSSIENPYDRRRKVFEAYVQNRTPGAWRVFWCYGPGKGEITILAITPHP